VDTINRLDDISILYLAEGIVIQGDRAEKLLPETVEAAIPFNIQRFIPKLSRAHSLIAFGFIEQNLTSTPGIPDSQVK